MGEKKLQRDTKRAEARAKIDRREQKSDEWRGWRFVVLSLAVTTASIIFFFAGRHFFPNIVVSTRSAWGFLAERATEWGGVRLKTIELNLISESSNSLSSEPTVHAMSPFESLSTQLKEDLSIYYGSAFWSLDLGQVKQRVLAAGWVKAVYLRRSFPDLLKIEVLPKNPVFLVRASRQWIAVDDEGSPLWMSGQVPGAWVNLPIIFGLEKYFDRGQSIQEVTRQVTDERESIKDAYQLVLSLRAKLQVEVESISIRNEMWSKRALLTAKFSLPNSSRKSSDTFRETKYEITFLSHQWASRVSALQFVLSDLSSKEIEKIRILGQYDGKWIVQDLAMLGPEHIAQPHLPVLEKVTSKKSNKVLSHRKKRRI